MRRNHYKAGIVGRLAMENEAEALPPAGEEAPVAEAAPDNAESLETDLILVAGDVEELVDVEADIEGAAEVVEELEVAAEALRDVVADGGLDKNGARMLNLHLDSLYKRVGMDRVANTLSCESFGNTGGRAETTKLALEAVAQNAKDLWKAILDLIEKSIKYLKEMFAKMFDSAAKLKARAEATVKRAEGIKSPAASKSFEKDSLVAALHVSGKVNPVVSAKALADLSVKLTSSQVELHVKAAEAMLAALSGTAGVEALKGVNIADFKLDGETAVTDAASVGIKAPIDGMKIARGAELPGGRALVAVTPASAEFTPAQAAETRVKMGNFSVQKAPAKVQLEVLSTGDAAAVAKSVISIADAVLAFKAKTGAIDQLKAKIVVEAKKQANVTAEAPKDGAAGPSTAGKISPADARALAKGAVSVLDQPAAAFMPYQLNTGKALLDYVELSLKAYAVKGPVAKEGEGVAPKAA